MFDALPFAEVCELMARRFTDLDAERMLRFASEDLYTGWDNGTGDYPCGSMWGVDGRLMYALIRSLRPHVVVEIGTHVGCSATHIGSALKANGVGRLYTIDTDVNAGTMIAPEVTNYVTRVYADAGTWLDNPPVQPDVIFEDGWHDTESVKRFWITGLNLLRDGGMMISHDAAHFEAGDRIRRGIHEAGIDNALIVRPAPSDCGFAFYRKEKA